MVIKCPNGNHFVNDMASMCPHCGAKLKDDVPSSEVPHEQTQILESINNEEQSDDLSHSKQYAQVEMMAPSNPQEVEGPQVDVHKEETLIEEKNYEETPSVQAPEPTRSSVDASSISSYSAPVAPIPETNAYQEAKKSNGTLIGIIVLLALIICGVGGYFYYDNVYLPEKIDREAPRYYSMANVIVLRSSRSAETDFNKVASLPYGTELITYEIDSEWARVKVNSQNGDKQEGFVASSYILNKADFFLMNSIFGNQNSKETISTTKCRTALLNYFKKRQYIGNIDNQMRVEVGISIVPNAENQWQVFTKPKDAKPNSVFFKRLFNKSSKFTDFAVIIKNSVSGIRKLLYFYFDENESPHLLTEQDAPSQGDIVDISYEYDFYSASKVLNVDYSY